MKRTYLVMASIMVVLVAIIGAFTFDTKANQPTLEHLAKPKLIDKKQSPLLIVVNKKHPLPESYNPYHGSLEDSNASGIGLLPEANKAKNKIIEAMQKAGFPIADEVSGYRSFKYQTQLYNNYVADQGKKKADTFSARPGYSDHQTGLAFDLLGTKGDLPTDDKMYSWLENNAYKYGIIIRFPRNETKKTGYMGEEWHLRYIGVKYATQMHDKNIETLEEFTGIRGGDYNVNTKDDVIVLSEYKCRAV